MPKAGHPEVFAGDGIGRVITEDSMDQPIKEIISLGLQLIIALLVWRYYREKKHSLGEKYSTFGPRFWTGSVDACVLWPIGFVASVLLACQLPAAIGVGLVIVQNLAWMFYSVTMHARHGQTYGKMVCKVKVVDFHTEGAITFRQALLREGIPIVVGLGIVGYEIYLVGVGALSGAAAARGEFATSKAFWLLATLPFLWFLAETITMLTNEKRRALHDFIAGTVVIRTSSENGENSTA